MTKTKAAEALEAVQNVSSAWPTEVTVMLTNDQHREAIRALKLLDAVEAGRIVPVSKTAIGWLFGENHDGKGNWFEPDSVEPKTRKYWWRTVFRKLISAAPDWEG